LPGLSAGLVAGVHLPLRRTPDVVERDWLVALRRAGTPVTWNDVGLAPATALSVTSIADPVGGVAIALASRGQGTLSVADTLGLIDSVMIGSLGARILAPSVQGAVTVRGDSAAVIARAGQRPVRQLRPVLVIGSAGWEAKFVIAALEERGWIVHGHVRVSPTAVVAQGPRARIDTATYSAVIVLDSATAPAASTLIAYLRNGGGLVLAGNAGRVPALAAIAPARLAPLTSGSLLQSASATGRDGLPMHPLIALRPDAVPIDRRDDQLVVAARREGAGRIVVVGEIESWRWRMSGGAEAPAEHRLWWSRVVSGVAWAPLSSVPPADPEAAPIAALFDALGDPVAELPSPPRPLTPALPAWLCVSILGLLLFGWASRRLRGER
jgi:hypothetical protein